MRPIQFFSVLLFAMTPDCRSGLFVRTQQWTEKPCTRQGQISKESLTGCSANRTRCNDSDGGDNEALCTLLGIDAPLLSHLVELVSESQDRPVHDMKPMIREIVVERVFADESGDCVVGPGFEQHVDREIQLLLELLEKARQTSIYPESQEVGPPPSGEVSNASLN